MLMLEALLSLKNGSLLKWEIARAKAIGGIC